MLNRRGLLIVLTIIFSAGVTPIAIRITQSEGMPSLVIVLIRLWLISLALIPLIWTRYRQELLRLTPRQWLLSGIAGFWLSVNLLLLFSPPGIHQRHGHQRPAPQRRRFGSSCRRLSSSA